MNAEELKNDKKELNNSRDIIKDICQGDLSALKILDEKNLDMKAIKLALDFLTKNPKLSDNEKTDLLNESWRINFRAKPPTPEEFLSEKYLGPAATHTYQRVKDVFLQFMDINKPYRDLILYPHIGWGKELYKKECVFTPIGPKHIEDIKVGDEVCTADGKYSHVINKKTWENAPIYKIKFADGRESLSGGPHYWKAAYSNNSRKWNKELKRYERTLPEPCWKIITTEKLIEDMKLHPEHRWFIPITKPAPHKEIKHIIHPYILGVLLGDGCLRNQICIYNDDEPLIKKCTSILDKDNIRYSVYSNLDENGNKKKGCSVKYIINILGGKSSDFYKELERLNLLNTDSFSKFIPEEYLYDSIENRIQLLQGLMDTDGSVENKKGNCQPSFYSSGKKLIEDLKLLCYGLGASKTSLSNRSTKKGNGDEYKLLITFPVNDFNIFSLSRKQACINAYFEREHTSKQQRRPRVLHIQSIEETDLKGGVCIETDDSERLFLTNNYIVTHNSYLSTIITLYIATYVTLMRSPWKYFGLNPATQISQFLISYSLKKSSELLLEPFFSLLEASPFFEKVNRREAMKAKEEEFAHLDTIDKIYYTTAYPTSALGFSSGLTIKIASNPMGIIGTTIISAVMSELAFFTDAGKTSEYIMRIYNDTKSRVESRMKGNFWGRTILDSSPNDLNNAIDHYIMNEARNNPRNYIVEGSMWKWEPEDYQHEFDNHETFKVYIGGKGNPPRMLEPSDPLLEPGAAVDPTKIIEVPNSMHQFFVDDLPKALKDRAGIPSGSSNSLINDYSIIERIFNNKLRNIYGFITAPDTMNPTDLIWNQIVDIFFKKKAGRYEYYYKPYLPRCVSVDQSYQNDLTAIACSHIERYFDSGENIYVVDFSIVISPNGGKINLESIRCFIEDLKYKGHLNIEHISFDQFQSETTIQNLKRENFDVERLSVDKSMDPYLNMVSLMKTNRIAVGKNIFLKNNLKSLNIVQPKSAKGKIKIDHDNSRDQIIDGDGTWETSQLGYFGKDTSDAVAASIELNRIYYNVVDAQWDGGPKEFEKSSIKEKETAMENMKSLLNKYGLR